MSDVVYDDDWICILRPDAPRGVLCITRIYSDCIDAVDGIDKQSYPTEMRRNNVFFRAATKLNPGIMHQPVHWVDELATYFNSFELATYFNSFELQPSTFRPGGIYNTGLAVIRVDPDRTAVYYSEHRVHSADPESVASRLTYADFLYNSDASDILNGHPKHRNAEIVYPHGTMPSSWFVYCRVPGKHGHHGTCAAVSKRT